MKQTVIRDEKHALSKLSREKMPSLEKLIKASGSGRTLNVAGRRRAAKVLCHSGNG